MSTHSERPLRSKINEFSVTLLISLVGGPFILNRLFTEMKSRKQLLSPGDLIREEGGNAFDDKDIVAVELASGAWVVLGSGAVASLIHLIVQQAAQTPLR